MYLKLGRLYLGLEKKTKGVKALKKVILLLLSIPWFLVWQVKVRFTEFERRLFKGTSGQVSYVNSGTCDAHFALAKLSYG